MSAMGTVLVVEPEPIVAQLVERRLRAAGFEARAASTAFEAIELASREVPDVILLAMSLPDADGFTTLARLRALPALEGVSIALMSAMQRDPESLVRGLELGADDYLRKPIEHVELVARVRALLRLRRHIAELQLKSARLAELNAELERVAVRDGLTGVYNRRHLEQRLGEEVERARRYGQPLAVVVCDVDRFKSVNDTYGHAAGDAVLRGVATCLQATVRRTDLLARFGGEEFVVVAPSTDAAGGRTLAERARLALAAAPILASAGSGAHTMLRVTASFGVAATQGRDGAGSRGAEELLAAADAALYRAKANGRNRVEVDDEA